MSHHVIEINHHIYNLQSSLEYLKAYGYAFLFVGTFLEGEIVLLIAGFLAYLGTLNFWWVVAIAFLGATVGDNFWFYVGRKGGRAFIERYGKYFFMSKRRIKRAELYFENHGKKTVFFSRFVFGTRISSAVLAGAFGMKNHKFIWSNIIGAAVWSLITAGLGFFFGRSFQLLARGFRRTELALLILCLAAIIILLLRRIVTKAEQK